MKRILAFWMMALAVIGLVACSADYDTFGSSSYKTFNDIRFVEQDGGSSVYTDEHVIKVTTVAPPESLETWDSLTVEALDVSSLATVHLVDGKFKEFPSDSAALDSLAEEVSYVKDRLRAGDKVRVPKSLQIYLMVVAENGDPAIWRVDFTIPGVEAASSSSSDDGDSDGVEDSSSSSDEAECSSSAGDEDVSSSSVALSDNNDFEISFKDEVENVVSGDTVYVTFAQGTDLSKVKLDTAVVHRSAKIDVAPSSVESWTKVQKFVVTAENGDKKTWYVVVQAVLCSGTDLTIAFKNQLKVNKANDTIAVKLVNGSVTDVAKAVVESFTVSDGASISPEPTSLESWAASQKFTVTAENGAKQEWVLLLSIAEADEVASSEKDLLSISATGEIAAADIDAANHTIVIHMASDEARANVVLSMKLSDGASHNLGSSALDLRGAKEFEISAEDGSSDKWTISADYPLSSEADVLTFDLDGITATVAPKIDATKHTISFEVPYGTDLSAVYFTATYSDYAKLTTAQPIDLSSGKAKLAVSAQDGSSVEWNVEASVAAAPAVTSAPRILSMKIAGQQAVVDSISENGKLVHWVHYDNMTFLADLSALTVSDIKLTEGATIKGVAEGSSYDLSFGQKVTVSNGSESVDYEIRAGYQYPNSNFESWSGNKPASWDNGNQSIVTITSSTSSSGGKAVYMQTKSAVGVLASGNLFVGKMNPKGVNALSMTGYKDGNELIDFGKPFAARPRYLEVDLKYDGKGDSCDVYLVLENRTSTKTCTNGESAGSNVCRTSSDVNTLVASAWYRATTDNDFTDPDVVSISDVNASTGMRTLRLKLKYGEPYATSPIMNIGSGDGTVSTLYAGGLVNSKGVDNHVVMGDGTLPATHIRVVFAASGDGNHYKGSVGATLVVDNFKLIY